jgi:hypothetical protein
VLPWFSPSRTFRVTRPLLVAVSLFSVGTLSPPGGWPQDPYCGYVVLAGSSECDADATHGLGDSGLGCAQLRVNATGPLVETFKLLPLLNTEHMSCVRRRSADASGRLSRPEVKGDCTDTVEVGDENENGACVPARWLGYAV